MREGNGNPLQYYHLGIPQTEGPGRLWSMGSARFGHDWALENSEWEKIMVYETTDKGLISKIYKQLIQCNIRKEKKKTSPIKNRQKALTDISPKKTYRCLIYSYINTWRHWISLIARETQIKTTMMYHLTPIRMAIIQKPTNSKC